MEVFTIKENFYIMIKKKELFCLLVLLLHVSICIIFVDAVSAGAEPINEKKIVKEEQNNKIIEFGDCFKKALEKEAYIINPPEAIRKPEVVDNLKRIKSLFGDQDDIFFSYITLNRYTINSNKNDTHFRFYCFQFEKSEDAAKWFDVVEESKSQGNRRLVVFSKPKKLLALAKDKVFLLEGYHISNFDALEFIMAQLENVEYVLGPSETSKVSKN